MSTSVLKALPGKLDIKRHPPSVGCCPFKGGGSVIDDSLRLVAPIVCGRSVFGPYFVMHYNQATTNLAFHSNETSKDKRSII